MIAITISVSFAISIDILTIAIITTNSFIIATIYTFIRFVWIANLFKAFYFAPVAIFICIAVAYSYLANIISGDIIVTISISITSTAISIAVVIHISITLILLYPLFLLLYRLL